MKATKASLSCLLILLLSTMAFAQTADEVIAKAIAAEGGAARKAWDTVMSKGKVSFPMQGMEGEFVVLNKRPNNIHLKINIQGMEIVQATNGTDCWMINPFMGSTDPTEMPEAQATAFLRGADFDGPYYNLEAKGITAEFVGKDTIGDLEVNHIKLTHSDGHVEDLFFAADAGLLYQTKQIAPGQMGGEVDTSVTLSDYREINGVMFPFQIDQSAGGMEMIITFDEITPNVDVDDSIFEMPEPEAEEEEKAEGQ